MKRMVKVLALVTGLVAAAALLSGCASKLPEDTLKATINGVSYTFTNEYTDCIMDIRNNVPASYAAKFQVKDKNGGTVYDMFIDLYYGLSSGTYSEQNGDIVFFVDAYDQDGEFYSMTSSALPRMMPLGGYTLKLTNSTDNKGNMTIRGRFSVTLGGNYRDANPKFLEIQDSEFELHIPANAWD